jgi:hypothetical protein
MQFIRLPKEIDIVKRVLPEWVSDWIKHEECTDY